MEVNTQIYDLFKESCEDRDHTLALQLLESHGLIISSHSSMYANTGAFTDVCRNGWRDIAGLLIDGFGIALSTYPFYQHADTFRGFIVQGWTDLIVSIINGVPNPKCRLDLINQALKYWFTEGQFDMCRNLMSSITESSPEYASSLQHVIDQFDMYQELVDDIDDRVLRHIVCFKCIHGYYDSAINTRRHEFVNAVVSRFGDRISTEACEQALVRACRSGCENILDLLASSLSPKLDPKVYDKVIGAAIRDPCWSSRRRLIPFINRFHTRLSTPTCQQLFDRVYRALGLSPHIVPSMLIACCLECFGDRVTFKATQPCLLNAKTLDLKAILHYSSKYVSWVARNRWSDRYVMDMLVEHYRDKINGRAIIRCAIMNVNRVITDEKHRAQQLLDATESCKHILNHFFTDIDCARARNLLRSKATILYSILSPDDVKILIDTYKHGGDLDRVVELMDPNHENTRYVLSDYWNRRIKAANA